MANTKVTIDFRTFEDQLRAIEEAGGSVRPYVSECLNEIQREINQDLRKAMAPHRGKHSGHHTVDSIIELKAAWKDDVCTIDLGFDIANGGLASIFLMYGTKPHGPRGVNGTGHPGTKPDQHLKNAIFGTAVRARIMKLQEEALAKASQEILGGGANGAN